MDGSSTPKSSPPSNTTQRSQQTSPTRRKRSHQDMNDTLQASPASSPNLATSHTFADEDSPPERLLSPDIRAQHNQRMAEKPSTKAHSTLMGPPLLRPNETPSSQMESSGILPPATPQTTKSSQTVVEPSHGRGSGSSTPQAETRSPLPQNPPEGDAEEATDNSSGEDDMEPPDQAIEPFNWSDLETRYHRMIEEKRAEEAKIYDDFSKLCSVHFILPL